MPPKADPQFRQCLAIDPEMVAWVDLACEYLGQEQKPQRKKLLFGSLRSFLRDLIIGQVQPRDPGVFLNLSYKMPPLECALGEGNSAFRRQKKNKIYDFLVWILETRFSQQLPNGNSIVLEGYRIPFSRSNTSRDASFLWLTAAEPELELWRRHAANYLSLQPRNRLPIRIAIDHFFEGCIVSHVDRFHPSEFFDSIANLPPSEDFFLSVSEEHTRRTYQFNLGDFLNWVLDKERALDSKGLGRDWCNPYPPPRQGCQHKVRMDGRGTDLEFRWILERDPEMEFWRLLASEYTSQTVAKNPGRWLACREYIGYFLDRYIIELNQPRDPLRFLHIDYTPPSLKCAHFRTSSNPLPVLYDFVKWILRQGIIHLESGGKTVVRSDLRNPFAKETKIGNKSTDRSFSWLPEIHPLLEEWRCLGEGYICSIRRGLASAMTSLNVLFSQVVVPNPGYWNPAVFLSRKTLPESADWLTTASADWRGVVMRFGRDFADWILANHLSVEDDHGRKVLPYEFKNPFDDQVALVNSQTYHETTKVPLPYRYIDECRRILNEGPSFRDWAFAQRAFSGTSGGDWFEVPYETIDLTDPDCVWEQRAVNVHKPHQRGRGSVISMRTGYFLWCPARAVALYMKLLLPLRTYQVRVLDSGEADTFRFCPKAEDKWSLNASPFLKGSEKRPHQRGVFRRFSTPDGELMTGLYINTNKTADLGKDGASRGYFIPWQYDEVLQWLAKLRDWQEKYNPITAPTSWTALDNRHSALKSETELVALGETCFLFRDAAGNNEDRDKPLRRSSLEGLWTHLCQALEARIYAEGRRLPNGDRIRFARLVAGRRDAHLSLFPLHSVRVSLLTLFALEGGVPLVYLSKLLAGHSRLLMTIYYIKPGIIEMTETMAEAMNHIDNNKLDAEVRWLAEAGERDLERNTAHNDRAALDAVLNSRPGGGWIWDSKGVCPVGRSRCNDGGPIIYGNKTGRNGRAPVPGGPGNCVRCRFFITGPAFLPGLVTHQNLLLYRFGELGRRCQETDERISNLKDNRDAAIAGDTVFSDEERRELCRLEVELERIQGQIDRVGGDVIATHKLLQRSRAILNQSADDDLDSSQDDLTVALVAAGRTEDVRVSLEEVTELHQLSVLCENAVLYPESEDDSAIYRRSQLIDAALETHRLKPLLCRLSREEQLRVGNHLMRFLSAHAGSLRDAVGILESTVRLADIGLLTDAIRSAGDRSQAAKPVSLVTLSRAVALNEAPSRQVLSVASGNRNGGI